jgi:lipopolysaccharide/colanic/teichoic acid biosynthesis glycosyltransferase
MDAYLLHVHNLSGNSQFSRLTPRARSAIVSLLTDSLRDNDTLENIISKESSSEVLEFIKKNLDIRRKKKNIVFSTLTKSYVEDVDFNNLNAIIDFKRANKIRHINGLFRAVNELLPEGGIYVGRLETYWERKLKIYLKYGRHPIGRLLWIGDFVLNRIIPRVPVLQSLYYLITHGEYHSMSRAEVLGRLVYCGFQLKDFTILNGLSYFVAVKTSAPSPKQSPSFYPIIRLQRVGQQGKMIGVYKFRTMHPYSEYLQDYVVRLYGYNQMGKPDQDFRLTRWGKWMRRFGIDELPQLINVMKGEMKLVGLRPLSLVRYNEFPNDLQLQRIKYKPGCIPPYIALNMPDDKMNIEAERIYIKDLTNHSRTTDFRYFFKAIFNLLTHKSCSA